jgi:hypothetical protein
MPTQRLMAGTYVYVTTVLLMEPLVVVLLSVLRPLLLLTPPELALPEPARTFDLIFICVFLKVRAACTLSLPARLPANSTAL